MSGRLYGKVALVTGAAGGIGPAIVRVLQAEGAAVAVSDQNVDSLVAEARFPGNLLDHDFADGLPSATLAALVGPVFDKIAASLVDAFVKRAETVYG